MNENNKGNSSKREYPTRKAGIQEFINYTTRDLQVP